MADQDTTVPGSGYNNVYLDSLIWGARWTGSPITFYFGSGTIPDSGGQAGYGWFDYEREAFRQVTQLFENVCNNIDFQEVNSYDQADIAWWLVPNSYLGGSLGQHDVPDGQWPVAYGWFNVGQHSWTQSGLQQGGYGFLTILHELGHGLGLAHPHDGGSESNEIFPGVDGPFDAGDYGLNQGIWTMMSYNDGWRAAPSNSYAYGWEGTPMALDIAALQELYGANMSYQTGDNSYALPGVNASGTFWSCIWDAGGEDTITAEGLARNVFINLNDAPLTGANAGGYVSWMAGIRGGFTIANGVVIENAIGGDGNDKIVGNEVANELIGGLGNDTIVGGEGADSIKGGGGNDLYVVDDLVDSIIEEEGGELGGIDLVKSSVSFALGQNFENLMLTGIGSIEGIGNELENVLVGNAGNNTLDGGLAGDKMAGGAGDDLYRVEDGADVVIESLVGKVGGSDGIESGIDLTLGANLENLTLTGKESIAGTGNALPNGILGNDGANSLLGLAGNDTIGGGAGNDTLNGGADSDILSGGEGQDTYIVDNKSDQIGDAGGIDLVLSVINYKLGADFENLTLIGKAAAATGNDLGNEINGNAFANTLDGGAGNDSMAGGWGNDVYHVDSGADDVIETDGTAKGGVDTIVSEVDYTLGAFEENLTLDAEGDGKQVTGNGLNNVLIGNSLANRLDGGDGKDRMAGLGGDDTYVVDSKGDIVTETLKGDAGGTDTVESEISFVLGTNLENLTLIGIASSSAIGNGVANILIGNDGNNTLNGAAGADEMTGGAGNDTYVVDSADDKIDDSSGIDKVQSLVTFTLGTGLENLELLGGAAIEGKGNDAGNIITGNNGANRLSGFGGADTLNGGLGNDVIVGGAGDDSINVNKGNDRVFYTDVLDGNDKISGFDGNPAGGQDQINLDLLFDSLDVAGTDRAARVEIAPVGGGVEVRVDTDGNAGFELVITLATTDAITLGADVILGS